MGVTGASNKDEVRVDINKLDDEAEPCWHCNSE